jgi:hypothetical protein
VTQASSSLLDPLVALAGVKVVVHAALRPLHLDPSSVRHAQPTAKNQPIPLTSNPLTDKKRCMTVRDMLTTLQTLPRNAELLAFEAGCEDYCEREVDEVQWQGGQVYLHLGVRRDNSRQH